MKTSNKTNADYMLKQALQRTEVPSDELLTKIKCNTINERPAIRAYYRGRKLAVAAVAVIATVTMLSAVAVAAGPAIVEHISRIIFAPRPTHEIEDAQRDISFSLELISRDNEVQGHHVSLEDAAKIAAEAIYEEFDFCLDGMVGYVTFIGCSWSGFIVSEELTRHAMGAELFHFRIDAVTGEVLQLIMNTPETPLLG